MSNQTVRTQRTKHLRFKNCFIEVNIMTFTKNLNNLANFFKTSCKLTQDFCDFYKLKIFALSKKFVKNMTFSKKNCTTFFCPVYTDIFFCRNVLFVIFNLSIIMLFRVHDPYVRMLHGIIGTLFDRFYCIFLLH